MNRNDLIHEITGLKPSLRSGAKAKLGNMLNIPPSSISNWAMGGEGKVINTLLIILNILKRQGMLEKIIKDFKNYEN
jgi:hypothetical protein